MKKNTLIIAFIVSLFADNVYANCPRLEPLIEVKVKGFKNNLSMSRYVMQNSNLQLSLIHI